MAEHERLQREARKPDAAPRPIRPAAGGSAGAILALQRTAGNAAVTRLLQREPSPDAGVALNDALAQADWSTAAQVLADFGHEDRLTEVRSLSPDARQQLRDAALGLDPQDGTGLAADIEAAEPSAPAPASAAPADAAVDVAAMSATDKLSQAWEYAKPNLRPDMRAQLDALFSPESIGMLVGFAVVYVAAQLTPAGWVADGVALATLTISAIFVGRVVFDVAVDLGRFFAAVNATTDDDLKAAGAALSHGVSEATIAIMVALLTHAVGRTIGGARPMDGPPPTGYVEALTPEGQLIRMPASAVAEVATAPPSVYQQAALMSVAGPPTPAGPTGGGGAGDGAPGGAPPPARGPEVFDEISAELHLDPASADGAPSGAAGAAADAQAAGLMGPQGQPGTVDLATQPHSAASAVRGQYGVSGADVQSAHIGPTSFLRDLPNYSRSQADTALLDRDIHAAFDRHWKEWAMDQRRAGRTQVAVSELYSTMLDAIEQIPGIEQRMKNALAWRLQLEIFSDLGLSGTDQVGLPYPNIPASP